ncbi:MAG TPA: hypothetical protein PLI43_01035 [Albidovulum sp.]|uniref:hypothetical protein n=1 Tax=Albidovulum sp. TaxID=1872424 RepID=UPI002CFCF74A|nr:hypothetical protein [Albidovulum sp.]
MDRTNQMKLFAIILAKFSRKQDAEADAFEKRLVNLGKQASRRSRAATPNLFVRHAHA